MKKTLLIDLAIIRYNNSGKYFKIDLKSEIKIRNVGFRKEQSMIHELDYLSYSVFSLGFVK